MEEKAVFSINEKVRQENAIIKKLVAEIEKVIVGQKYLIERLLVGLLANGHILIEGVPGLAKTLTARVLAESIKAEFKRIQFTPDLLPADLIGTLIYSPQEGEFKTRKGPIFANLILADEINRAPAKVQSALLEAMQERQVTIGGTTYKLDEPFLVLATQNPIEHEGTYNLPEAQKDRFMLKVNLGYSTIDEEHEILKRMGWSSKEIRVSPVIDAQEILRLRSFVDKVYMDEKIERYILNVIFATRNPGEYHLDDLSGLIRYGASPRATIYMTVAAKAHAFIMGRGYVTPQDVKAIGPDVLRHRVLISYEAEAEEKTPDAIIQRIFQEIEIP